MRNKELKFFRLRTYAHSGDPFFPRIFFLSKLFFFHFFFPNTASPTLVVIVLAEWQLPHRLRLLLILTRMN
jgi:hypothetical protein